MRRVQNCLTARLELTLDQLRSGNGGSDATTTFAGGIMTNMARQAFHDCYHMNRLGLFMPDNERLSPLQE